MKILKTKERKLYASILIILLLIGVSIYSVNSVTRTISDSQDTIETFIKTSDGKYFSTTNTGLNNSIDSLPNGGTIWLPGNTTYSISTVDFESNINYIGGGYSTHFSLIANSDLVTISTEENILIENIRFDGNNESVSAGNAIDITGASKNITIQNCWFVDCDLSFIDCEEGTSFITIEGCFFKGIEESASHPAAVWFAGSHCIVKNNYMEDCYGSGVVCESETGQPPSSWHIIDGNVITGNTGHGIHMERNGSQSYLKSNNCTIINNHIYDLYSAAYGSSDYSSGILLSENTTCSNNKIYNVHKNGISVCGNNTIVSDNTIDGVWLANGAGIAVTSKWYYSQVIISDNIIRNITDQAINVMATSGMVIVKITGNIIEDTGDQAISSSGDRLFVSDNYFENIGTNGVELASGTANATISNNYFYNIDGTYGVYILSSGKALITGNYFYDMVSYAIYITTGGEYNIISSNFITKCGTDGIHLHNVENSTIIGNQITGCVDGIEIDDGHNLSVVGNHVWDCTDGIDETGTCTYNAYAGNVCTGNSGNDFSLGGAGDESAANIGD